LIILVITPEDAGDRLNHRTLGVLAKVRTVCLGVSEARTVVIFRKGVLRTELTTTVIAGVSEGIDCATLVTLGHLTVFQL
jgi:plasmid replication initiation protein